VTEARLYKQLDPSCCYVSMRRSMEITVQSEPNAL